ncbi:hypothetical protein Tco_0561249 [Tanacetum coccineum]
MAESSSPDITTKEEPITLDRPESPSLFLHAIQVKFTFEEISFSTNNEVALLYPSHPNQEYFKDVSDFIFKCCLKEAFTRALNQYKEYLSEFWYVPLPSITTVRPWFAMIGYNREIKEKGTLKKSYLPPRWMLMMGKRPRARSRLKRKQSSKHTSESTIEASKSQSSYSKKETKSCSAMDKSPNHPSPSTPMVGEMHKEAQQAAGGPTSLGATSEERAHPQLSSGSNPSVLVDKTKSAGDGLKTVHTNSGISKKSKADEISKKIKLEDLSDLLKDTRSTFFTPDSSTDEPIIVSNESEEEESQKKELEHQKAAAEAEAALLKAKPSYPDINQLTTLLELLAEFLDLPHLVSSVQEKLKTLDSLPYLLKKVNHTLNRFATLVENASEATTTGVPSADKATASLAEGEKDADTNLKNELVDLLGVDIVTRYYNKKLLYERYCEKMKKRRQSSKIINYDVLTKKGPISLKVYREDMTAKVIENFKASDLQLAEWRELVQACPDRKEKG